MFAHKNMQAISVVDCLRADNKMAAYLPAVARMQAIQSDCARVLPHLFGACVVRRFESGVLVLSIPNAALATRLKQQLVKLQHSLVEKGWEVQMIQLKIDVKMSELRPPKAPKPLVSAQGVASLSALVESLDNNEENALLEAALRRLMNRSR